MVSGVLYRFKLVLPSLLFLFPIYRFTQRVTSSWINYLRFLERWAWDAFAFIRTVVTGCFRPSRSSRRGSRDLWDGIESNLSNWLIFTVCHVLERFRSFSSYGKFPTNVKTRGSVSFFLMTVYIYYFLVAMLRYCWRKATEYRVSLNKRPHSYQFSLSSLS